MSYANYDLLKVTVERGVASVLIDNPPINLRDMPLIEELTRLGTELEADDAVRVVVFSSADPDFFIAHADVTLIQQIPVAEVARPDSLSFFHQAMEKFRTMPKVTIGNISPSVLFQLRRYRLYARLLLRWLAGSRIRTGRT